MRGLLDLEGLGTVLDRLPVSVDVAGGPKRLVISPGVDEIQTAAFEIWNVTCG